MVLTEHCRMNSYCSQHGKMDSLTLAVGDGQHTTISSLWNYGLALVHVFYNGIF